MLQRQRAWEQWRAEERRQQAEEWAEREAAMNQRRQRVQRGLGLEVDEELLEQRRPASGTESQPTAEGLRIVMRPRD